MPRTVCQLSLLVLCVSLLACGHRQNAAEQSQGDDRSQVELTMNGKRISVDYSRPLMNGNDLLANAREGSIERLGINRTAIFTTDTALVFGRKVLPPGVYSLWTQHASGQNWWLIFNRNVNVEEKSGDKHDDTNDTALIPFVHSKGDQSVERFTITLTGKGQEGHLTVLWGIHRLDTTFKLL